MQVRKYTREDQTYTAIESLGKEERIGEVARMLGGQEITRKTLDPCQGDDRSRAELNPERAVDRNYPDHLNSRALSPNASSPRAGSGSAARTGLVNSRVTSADVHQHSVNT